MRYKEFGGNEMQSKVKKNRRAYLGVYKKLKEHYKDTIIIADLHSGEIRYKLSSSADYSAKQLFRELSLYGRTLMIDTGKGRYMETGMNCWEEI